MKTIVAAALALLIAVPAAAVPPPEAYGALPSVDLITLSPDGSLMATRTGVRLGVWPAALIAVAAK
ncbi:MAG: hypothetical protein JO290_11295 [Sphingomonadaceae bacterium]|nr:hypothetical protein [Sphingomonadaceae bacterium]